MCKFLISSEILKQKIKLVLANPPKYFSIDPAMDEFTFECSDPIKMYVTNARQKYRGKFSYFQWQNIYNWLQYLTEQPLTVKLSDYGDEVHMTPEISVYCEGVTFYYTGHTIK